METIGHILQENTILENSVNKLEKIIKRITGNRLFVSQILLLISCIFKPLGTILFVLVSCLIFPCKIENSYLRINFVIRFVTHQLMYLQYSA